jgi:hypothetical protein
VKSDADKLTGFASAIGDLVSRFKEDFKPPIEATEAVKMIEANPNYVNNYSETQK